MTTSRHFDLGLGIWDCGFRAGRQLHEYVIAKRFARLSDKMASIRASVILSDSGAARKSTLLILNF
jgi:hypothetical protein